MGIHYWATIKVKCDGYLWQSIVQQLAATYQIHTKQHAWILRAVLTKKEGNIKIHNTIYVNLKYIQQHIYNMLKICINQIKFDVYEQGRCDCLYEERTERNKSTEKISKRV